MSKEELKLEIGKVLDHFSDDALSELLLFLQEIDLKKELKFDNKLLLNKILAEDKNLLAKLAQ